MDLKPKRVTTHEHSTTAPTASQQVPSTGARQRLYLKRPLRWAAGAVAQPHTVGARAGGKLQREERKQPNQPDLGDAKNSVELSSGGGNGSLDLLTGIWFWSCYLDQLPISQSQSPFFLPHPHPGHRHRANQRKGRKRREKKVGAPISSSRVPFKSGSPLPRLRAAGRTERARLSSGGGALGTHSMEDTNVGNNGSCAKNPEPLEHVLEPEVVEIGSMKSKHGCPKFEFPQYPDKAGSNLGKVDTRKETAKASRTLSRYGKKMATRSRSKKYRLRSSFNSSRVLRSMSKAATVTPPPVNDNPINHVTEKRKIRKKRTQRSLDDDFSKIRKTVRYLLHRMNYEQSLIDAYVGEGWKGLRLDLFEPFFYDLLLLVWLGFILPLCHLINYLCFFIEKNCMNIPF
ncbi:hypothetical protein Taro_026818, partial [Colocasia esculenta]|nr:hypothetical protein [Colocasia esculenta]